VNTNIKKYGSAPFNVALIHGGPGAAGEMAPVAAVLSEQYGVLEPLQTADTVSGQILELKDVLVQYADSPVVLVGFSWGAWLSVMLACEYPQLVKKLILIGCAPFDDKAGAVIHQTRVDRLDQTEKKEFDELIKSLGNPETVNKENLLKRLIQLLDQTDTYSPIATQLCNINFDFHIFKNVWAEASLMRQKGSLLESFKRVKCPIYAIHGDYDPHPWNDIKTVLSRNSGKNRFVLLEKCGHKPWVETHAKKDFYKIINHEIFSITH